MAAAADPVQEVFNAISLKRNISLWLSEDDSRIEERLKLLSQHEETKFPEFLKKNLFISSSSKSSTLAAGFLKKSQELTRSNKHQQALTCLNRALILAPKSDQTSVYEVRINVLRQLNHEAECRQDLEVIKRLQGEEISRQTEEKSPAGFLPLVKVSTDPEKGRFLVAEVDIPAGTLIATDKPLVKVLKKEFMKSHCWNCLQEIGLVLFPCNSCSDVSFCSPGCADEAADLYHSSECGKVQLLYSADLGTWLLAFRALSLKSHGKTASSSEFSLTMNLVTHSGSKLFQAPELMKEALIAVFLTRVWSTEAINTFSEEQMRTALFLHKFMRIARFNSHEVVWSDDQGRLKVIGFALNPLLAMANHSCDSNYGRVWLGGHTVMAFSTRPIRKGQEVSDSYSGIFAYSDVEERRAVHERYHFRCACIPCVEEWPMLNDLKKDLPKELISVAKTAKDVESVRKLLDIAYEVLRPPHALFVEMEDKMHSLLWDRYKSINNMKPY